MPVIANRDRPVPIILGTLIAISIPLAIWLDFALMLSPMAHVAQTMAYPHQPAVVVFFITVAVMTLGQPVSVVIPLLLGLAVVPLIGVAWSHRCAVRSSAPHWIALDPLPADWLPPGPNSELRTAIRVGLLSAVGGTLIAQILLAVGGSATTMHDIQVIAGLGQLVAAVLASARTRHLRSLHGIVAAFVAGSIVLLINLIGWRLATGNSWGRDAPSFSPIPTPLEWTVTVAGLAWGLLATAVAALITAKLAYTIRPAPGPSE